MGDFAIGWDFSAFNGADYREDSTGVVDIPGTVTNDILGAGDVANFVHEDPEVEGVCDGETDQRVVLDLTKTNNTYIDVDFVAAINCNMDGSSVSKLYLHYHDQDNSLPSADDSTTPFEMGATAVEVTPLANRIGRPLDTFRDSRGVLHYDTRLVHIFPDATQLRYLGLNFNKQAGDAVRVGRLIGGTLFTPERQPSVGVVWGNHDTTLLDAPSPSAYVDYDRGRRYRTLTVQFEYINEEDTLELIDIFQEIGNAQPCFVIRDTDDPIRTSMYCRISSNIGHVEDWVDQQQIPSIVFSELVPQTKG